MCSPGMAKGSHDDLIAVTAWADGEVVRREKGRRKHARCGQTYLDIPLNAGPSLHHDILFLVCEGGDGGFQLGGGRLHFACVLGTPMPTQGAPHGTCRRGQSLP